MKGSERDFTVDVFFLFDLITVEPIGILGTFVFEEFPVSVCVPARLLFLFKIVMAVDVASNKRNVLSWYKLMLLSFNVKHTCVCVRWESERASEGCECD